MVGIAHPTTDRIELVRWALPTQLHDILEFGIADLSWLQYPIGRMPIYKLLQYGSGFSGLGGVAFWAWQWWSQAIVKPSIESRSIRRKAIVWCGIGLTAVLMMGLAIVREATADEGIAAIVVRAVIGVISGSFVGVGLYAIVFWVKH